MSRVATSTARPRERVFVCGVLLPDHPTWNVPEGEDPLAEMRELCAAAEVDVVGSSEVQRRQRPTASMLFGRGKVDEIAERLKEFEPDAVVVDNDLSPAQVRNLEKAWQKRVVDRSEMILDIFASRAQTRQARLSVELAQVEYLMPRLRRMWTHLERMEGAVGTRGPGETQLETDRRLLRKRITDLKRELAEIEERRQREVRSRSGHFTIGLVGYTNAGKSTLLNRLTQSDEFVADMLFATLDTRTRQWHLPDGRVVLLSDTVGFLQRLPHHLVASFHATLEEALHADLLLHVVDGSDRDAQVQIEAVDEVLAGLSWGQRADCLVLNKVDRADRLALSLVGAEWDGPSIPVSAKTGEGLDELTAFVVEKLDERSPLVEVTFPVADGRTFAFLKSRTAVKEEGEVQGDRWRFRVRLSEADLGNLRRTGGEALELVRIE